MTKSRWRILCFTGGAVILLLNLSIITEFADSVWLRISGLETIHLVQLSAAWKVNPVLDLIVTVSIIGLLFAFRPSV